MEKYNFCYVLLLLVNFSRASEQIFEDDDKAELHECVTMIIRRIELVKASDVTLINVDVQLVKELHSLPHPMRFISRSFYWPNDTLFNDLYVIQCRDYFVFAQGLDLVRRDPFWNPRANFIIIVEYPEDYLKDISDFLVHNHIYNIALLTYSENRSTLVYKFGQQLDKCGRPMVKKLQLQSRCSEIDNNNQMYKSGKKPTFRGCRVKFVSHNFWPFVSFEEKPAIDEYLLKLIRQYEGITVELVNLGIENFGTRLDNFTYTGMLHEIEEYKVEGAIGGATLTLDRMSNLDFIDPYMVDYYKIVIRRAKLLNKWSAVLKHFGMRSLWAMSTIFCIICVTATLMGLFRKHSRDTSRDILIVWGYFLNNINQKQFAKSSIPYRMVLLTILAYVMIILCATQASLLSTTTHPIRDDQPDTADEVVSNYQLLLSPISYSHFIKNPVIDLRNVNTSCKNTLDCMTQVMQADRGSFTISSDIYRRSNVWKFADENGELRIHSIREPVGTLLQTVYLRRGSSLVEPFNKLLLRVRSAGLIDKFVSRLHFAERLKYKFRARRHSKPQTLFESRGMFMVLIFGYGISVISFLLEYIRR